MVSASLTNLRTIDTLHPEDGCIGSLILFTQTLSILGGRKSRKRDDNICVGELLEHRV